MRKFNIGDKVRVIGNCNGHGYEIDKEYIIKCHDGYFIEPNENGYAYNLDVDICRNIIREKDMELVKPKRQVIFINDDDIRIRHSEHIIMDDMTDQNVLSNKDKEHNLYVKGEWNNMNKVLELWYARKRNKIIKEYNEKEREFNNSKELVIKYKEIIERFENELEELYKSEENIENNYIKDNNLSKSMYKYKINYDKLSDEFVDKYVIERDEKLHELDKLKEEIDAQLSLSSELDYQIEVLTTYGILDKKTKKMVD